MMRTRPAAASWGGGLFSVVLTIPGWPDVIGRTEAVQSGGTTRIGMNEVDMTERVSELDDEFGGRHAHPVAASFMVNTVASYLRAETPEGVRKAMLSATSPKDGPRMRALLAGQQAHAVAQTGDRTGALRHIREAEAAMDRAESRGKVFGSYDPSSPNCHVSQAR